MVLRLLMRQSDPCSDIAAAACLGPIDCEKTVCSPAEVESGADVESCLELEAGRALRKLIQRLHRRGRELTNGAEVSQNVEQGDRLKIGLAQAMRGEEKSDFQSRFTESCPLFGYDVDWQACDSQASCRIRILVAVAFRIARARVEPMAPIALVPNLFAELVTANPADNRRVVTHAGPNPALQRGFAGETIPAYLKRADHAAMNFREG
jgi:hypothetical protein